MVEWQQRQSRAAATEGAEGVVDDGGCASGSVTALLGGSSARAVEGRGGEGSSSSGGGAGGSSDLEGDEVALVQDLMRVQGALHSLVEMLTDASELLQVLIR